MMSRYSYYLGFLVQIAEEVATTPGVPAAPMMDELAAAALEVAAIFGLCDCSGSEAKTYCVEHGDHARAIRRAVEARNGSAADSVSAGVTAAMALVERGRS